MLVMLALFILYALALRTSMLMESRRYNQELQVQRTLAETAEASRLGELRAQMAREFAELHAAIGQMEGLMDRHEQSMKQALDEAANGLAALVAEMDDRIDRALARGAAETKGSRHARPRRACPDDAWHAGKSECRNRHSGVSAQYGRGGLAGPETAMGLPVAGGLRVCRVCRIAW